MKPHWLIPVDGSPAALRAVDHVARDPVTSAVVARISLLNVQPPLPSDVTRFVSSSVVQDYHREAANAALADARSKLEAAGIAYAPHIVVGDVAQTIADFARGQACTLIIMGSRGLGSVRGILLGSITTKVVHLTELPVMVVK